MGDNVQKFDVYCRPVTKDGKRFDKWGIMDFDDSSKVYTDAIYDDVNGIYNLHRNGFAAVKFGDRWIFIDKTLKQIEGTNTYSDESYRKIVNKIIDSKIEGQKDPSIRVSRKNGEDMAVYAILSAIGRNSEGKIIETNKEF